MNGAGQSLYRRTGAALVALLLIAHTGNAEASLPQTRDGLAIDSVARAEADYARFVRSISGVGSKVILANKPMPENSRAATAVPRMRAERAVHTAAGTGAGQSGYVHYFLLRTPDDELEIQVGIEMPDQAIAWSFPGLGVAISPFVEAGVIAAGGKEYEIWHLYGIRPFADDAPMAALRKELVARVNRRIRAKTPYCENDGPHMNCMSCLGFVLRVLFPGRTSDYPDLPREFLRAGTASRYTTEDLLLYLTGMLDLPTREARLQRIARLALPGGLREDVEELVYSRTAMQAAPRANAGASGSVQKRPDAGSAKVGARASQRRRL